MDKVSRYFDSEFTLLNSFFVFIFSMPISLGSMLFMIVQGDKASEDAVIIFSLFLLFYDLIYVVLYNLSKIPDFLLRAFLITNRKKVNCPENIYFDKNYKYEVSDKRYKLSENDYLQIKRISKKIVHKKLITRLAIVLTILTLVLPLLF